MTHEEEQRFEMLRAGPCAAPDYLRDYYGLDGGLSPPHDQMFDTYAKSLVRRDACRSQSISRFELERFMKFEGILTKKWAAAGLGMTQDSLNDLLDRLDKIGMQTSRYCLGPQFVAEALSEDLIRHLPRMRFTIFADNSARCERLHAELLKAADLKIEPLFCATSTRLQEYPRLYASQFDCLTCEPLSLTHSMRLDFGKPIHLPGDRCSKLFYLEHRDRLKELNVGRPEPADIGEYERFTPSAAHG